MATSVRTQCRTCGTVEVPSAAISLVHCLDAATGSWYRFVCPKCRVEMRHSADSQVVEILKSIGIKPRVWKIGHPDDVRPEATVLDEDAFIEFGRCLQAAPAGRDPFDLSRHDLIRVAA